MTIMLTIALELRGVRTNSVLKLTRGKRTLRTQPQMLDHVCKHIDYLPIGSRIVELIHLFHHKLRSVQYVFLIFISNQELN